MYAGLCNARGDYVAVMDADLQDPPSLLPEMVKILEDDRAFCERTAGMGLIFAPCSGFGFPGYVRVALCVPEDTAKRSVGAFRRLMDSYRQEP